MYVIPSEWSTYLRKKLKSKNLCLPSSYFNTDCKRQAYTNTVLLSRISISFFFYFYYRCVVSNFSWLIVSIAYEYKLIGRLWLTWLWFSMRNKTNHPISSNSYPSATAYKAKHSLKRGGLQNQRKHHVNFDKVWSGYKMTNTNHCKL